MPNKIEKPRKFEEYLQDKHAAQYQGLDDEMPDNFNEWLEDLGSDEMIEYADKWHDTYLEAIADVEGLEETIKQSLSDISGFSRDKFNNKFDGIYTELAQKISNRIKGEV